MLGLADPTEPWIRLGLALSVPNISRCLTVGLVEVAKEGRNEALVYILF